jgi:hypothetical protein
MAVAPLLQTSYPGLSQMKLGEGREIEIRFLGKCALYSSINPQRIH